MPRIVFNVDLLSGIRRLGIAVSGGADSVALLHLALPHCKKRGIVPVVLHYDHGIRGASSAADAQFVRALAEKLSLEFCCECGKVAPSRGVSLEMAARDARLAFFKRASEKCRLDAIASAHHADDAAETFVIRLLRAAGPKGLAGLREESVVDGIRFIRPLLSVRRGTLREWLVRNHLEWREDETNADNSILRNKIRNVIFPLLDDPVLQINKTARYISEDRACKKVGGKSTKRQAAGKLRGKKMPPTFGELKVPKIEISTSRGVVRDAAGKCATIDPAALGGKTLEIRVRRAGDKMTPFGMEGSRKVQDILTDLKIPRSLRDEWPLVVCGDEIVWIPLYRISRAFALPPTAPPDVPVIKLSATDF